MPVEPKPVFRPDVLRFPIARSSNPETITQERGKLSKWAEIDSETRKAIVREDPASDVIIRPYLRGQDLQRWHPERADYWMIG